METYETPLSEILEYFPDTLENTVKCLKRILDKHRIHTLLDLEIKLDYLDELEEEN